jgi:hypothetical protein
MKNGLLTGKEFGAVHVLLKIKKHEQNSGFQNAMWGCVLAHV